MSSNSMDGGPFPLTIVPPPPTNENGGPHRSQPSEGYVYQDGYNLSFDISFADCIFKLLDNDNEVIYTDSTDSLGNAELPDYLSGTYTLKIYVDNDVYQGELLL